jgi:hypothetical protein
MSIHKTWRPIERRKDPLLRSEKRSNFERRDMNRLVIDGDITVDYKFSAKLINIDYKGAAIECTEDLEDKNILINLHPYLNLKLDSRIVWKQKLIPPVDLDELMKKKIKNLNLRDNDVLTNPLINKDNTCNSFFFKYNKKKLVYLI